MRRVRMAQLVKDQTVCRCLMAGEERIRPALALVWVAMRVALGTGLDDRCRQAMRDIMDDPVHQAHQRHHEQSQG